MNREEHIIQKSFYEDFMQDHRSESAISVLGQYYFQEQKENQADLTEIRFAQGEIYYHAQDYETAIFKWENIKGEWEPWARKNMADAYFELELYDTAEEIYQSIKSDSLLLNTEIALQLFGLYILQRNNDQAKQMILNAVLLNPDYPNVTKLAKAFFEEQEDWNSAVELAGNEAIRTKKIEWFNILEAYVEQDHLCFEPTHFIPMLETVLSVNTEKFDQLSQLFWEKFEQQDLLFDWLTDFNTLILSINITDEARLNQLSSMYKETYQRLMKDYYPFQSVEKIMPTYLEAWVKVEQPDDNAFVYSAILTWNDHFPGNINQNIVDRAQASLSRMNSNVNIQESIETLIDDVKNWARKNEIEFEEWEQNIVTEQDQTEAVINGKKWIEYFFRQIDAFKLEIMDTIEKEQAICGRLKGSTNQLRDLEEEEAADIRQAFLAIEKELKEEMRKSIPELIKTSASSIKEDTEFRNLHLELNNEMNKRIYEYIQDTILPSFNASLGGWIEYAKTRLEESQSHLQEWEKGFNEYLVEDPVELQCDFQIIADWQRDADRMTIPMQIENENILLRRTPSQVLLKGAGKLLGGLTKNNAVLAKSYRNFIENENYDDVSESIATKFFYQFQLFEKGIGRDVQLFFRDPLKTLENQIEEMEGNIQVNQTKLAQLEENPDVFLGPLKLYQLQLNQYKWLNEANGQRPDTEIRQDLQNKEEEE